MAWTLYKEIKYDTDGIPAENLTDFPKLVSIAADADITAECSGGGGIKFTSADGLTDLDFGLYPSTDITSGDILARVKVTLLTAANVGDVICRLYYSSTETTTEDKAGTVSANYALFLTMDEDPSGGAPQIIDWTANNNDCTSGGTMTSGDLVAGQVGSGIDFDGTDDRLSETSYSGESGNPVTIEFWAKPTGTSADQYAIYREIAGVTANVRAVILGFQDGFWNIFNGAYPTGTAADTQIAATAGVWQYIAFKSDGSTVEGHLNGTQQYSVSANLNTAAPNTLRIATPASSNWYAGVLDEIRISNAARSTNWLVYTHTDESANADTFTLSTEQGGSGGSFTMPADPGSYAITGTVASLEQGYVIGADTGSFSISGVAANLNQGYEVAAVPGEYLVSGVDANFLLGFGFSADAGSYSITGTTTTLLVANLLNAEVGSYLVSGVAANLEQGYLLQVGNPTSGSSFGTGSNDSAVGTHAWTGPENVDMDDGVSAMASASFSVLNTQYLKVLDFSTLSIPPDASIVGLTVTVDRDPPGGANPTEFLKIVKGGIVVGNEISGVMGSGTVILGDSESLSGFGVSLLPSDIDENFGVVYRVTAGSAINSVGVDYIQVTVYYRENGGVYSVTGTDANFIEGFGLSADVGSYLVTGVSANLLQHSVLNAAVGSYVITGVAANLAENLENIVGGRFVAGQVYYPGFVNAEIFYPGFKQAQVNN